MRYCFHILSKRIAGSRAASDPTATEPIGCINYMMPLAYNSQMRSIPLIKPDLPPLEAVEAEFREILGNGKITNFGKYVTAFERESAEYLGADTVTTSSGTMGLLLTLQALGLKPSQKVILPSFTFMATG